MDFSTYPADRVTLTPLNSTVKVGTDQYDIRRLNSSTLNSLKETRVDSSSDWLRTEQSNLKFFATT